MRGGYAYFMKDSCWHGLIKSSHGKSRVLWKCPHKHRSSKTAIVCARHQLGIAEGTMARLWNRQSTGDTK